MTTTTTGNVLEDLGFGPADSADLALRAYLMADIRKFIEWDSGSQTKKGPPKP